MIRLLIKVSGESKFICGFSSCKGSTLSKDQLYLSQRQFLCPGRQRTQDNPLILSLPAHFCFSLGHFLSCLGQSEPLVTFSFVERGRLPIGRPVSTPLVLLLKKQQLVQPSAPRSLSLKLVDVIGRPLLALVTVCQHTFPQVACN